MKVKLTHINRFDVLVGEIPWKPTNLICCFRFKFCVAINYYGLLFRNGRRVGKNLLHCISFSNSAYYFGMRIGNFVDRPVEYPLLVHKLYTEKMNWSVSIAPRNSNYKSLRLAIPFVFIYVTCPLQRTMLLKAGMGSGEWDWEWGMER